MSGIIGINSWENSKRKSIEMILQEIPVSIDKIRSRSRDQILVKHRKTLALRMMDEGYDFDEIADTLNRHRTTIYNYL